MFSKTFVINLIKSLTINIILILGACAPTLNSSYPDIHPPQLNEKGYFTSDGKTLSVKSWEPNINYPKAIIIALHGFNDYANFFRSPGSFFANQAILSYAYDQRGFGSSQFPGIWSGTKSMVKDLKNFITLIKSRHPKIPIYLLGESMGSALIIIAVTEDPPINVDGVILSAPAVWGRTTMPWYQRIALWIGARIIPSITLTGEGLKLKPSDNLKMLLALGQDPLVIKKTRIDALYGLVNLMDRALDRASQFSERALILYGEKDEIIPLEPTRLMLNKLPKLKENRLRLALYKEGYHMLLRDLKAEIPLRDILTWIKHKDRPFESGADKDAYNRLSNLNDK